ncbi:MAG: thioredoxin family protein [Halobacteriales archaeon]
MAPRSDNADIVYLDDAESIEDHVDGAGPLIVDFHADWCGPCVQMEPVLDAVADSTPARVLKVDVDRRQDVAAEFGVRGIPTLLVYHEGEPVQRLVGYQSEAALRDVIAQYA